MKMSIICRDADWTIYLFFFFHKIKYCVIINKVVRLIENSQGFIVCVKHQLHICTGFISICVIISKHVLISVTSDESIGR